MKIINLELQYDDEYSVIDINKRNKVLISDYEVYVHFYDLFYSFYCRKDKRIKIKLGNNPLDAKNSLMLDFSNVRNIICALDNNKGSLFAEHINKQMIYINDDFYEELFALFQNIKSILNANDDSINYDTIDDFSKLVSSVVISDYDKKNTINIFFKLLFEYFDNNKNKVIFLFYDSNICDIDLKSYENIYSFDFAKSNKISEYNLIVQTDGMKDFNLEIVKEYIYNVYPKRLDKHRVLLYIKWFYLFWHNVSNICASNVDEYIVYYILMNKSKQKIYESGIVIDDNIKSFLASL